MGKESKEETKMKRRLSVSELHQLEIARKTLQMTDIMARILGGMTKEEAREIITKLTGKLVDSEKEEQ